MSHENVIFLMGRGTDKGAMNGRRRRGSIVSVAAFEILGRELCGHGARGSDKEYAHAVFVDRKLTRLQRRHYRKSHKSDY